MIYSDIYQGDYPVNITGLAQAYSRILMRAAYGTTKDERFDEFWAQAGDALMERQAYQRIKHWPGAPSISWQAERLTIILGDYCGDYPPIVDMEQKPGDPPLPNRTTCIALLRSWRKVVESAYRVTPWFYTNLATLHLLEPIPSDIAEMPLHLAWYPFIPADCLLAPETALEYLRTNKIQPPGGYDWEAWQYSDHVEGYPLIAAHASDWNITWEEWEPAPVMAEEIFLPLVMG